ncbi:pyocin knob domain-containing protein [Chryseobacterium hagamense]|uniref:Uncharacterized protein n=1 Tax=Chryseobacterium hagamense TaxID=395935 RepID=A0A511YJE3_9FLAO|nr:pyocin knob domain-containing protein [Chryseobacterium hagamense]GEN75321.1 hypothetical protein CHA01nite_10610 [Chryseobacterium hagamense]
MIAPEYFNNHIAVEGEIVVKRVPNDTGSVVVWNSVTNKLSIRTHAEIVSDLKILTTHTEQNVEGTKWFRTAGGSAYLNHRLRIISEDGSNPGMVFYKSGTNAGTLQYDGSHYIFTNSDTDGYGLVLSEGYKKSGSNDSHVLLGGGGHKAVSDFASSADLPNLVTKNTEQTITADKVFKKITTTDWVIPRFLAFPDASGALPNYIGFYMWNSQWQVNWRDASNTYAHPLLDIDGVSKNANFYGNTTSPKFTTPGGNSDQWNEAYHSIGNYVTLNTDQGVTGKKIFYNQGQNFGELPLVVWGNNGSKGGIGFVKGGTDSAILNFDTEFHFTNTNNDGYKFINAAGVKVAGSDDNHVILGGGGNKSLDELMTTNTEQDVKGTKRFFTKGNTSFYTDNALMAFSNDGSWPAITFYRNVDSAGQIIFYGNYFGFLNESGNQYLPIKTGGVIKDGFDDNYFLLAGGGHKELSSLIPYTGAIKNPDFNGKSLTNINRLFTNGGIKHNNLGLTLANNAAGGYFSSVLIKTGLTSGNMGTFTVKLYRYAHDYYEFNINNYKYNNSNYGTNVTWKAGNSEDITRIEFLKDSNNILYVNIVIGLGYPRIAITDFMAYSWDDEPFDAQNWSAEFDGSIFGLINEGQATPSDFKRDNYLPGHNHTHQSLFSPDTLDVDANSLFHESEFKFNQRIHTGSSNMFPMVNNANSILSISTHPGGYGGQLGFNGDYKIYFRGLGAGNWSNWRELAYTDWVSANFAASSELGNYWKKYDIAGIYNGIKSDKPFAFLTEGDTQQKILTGGVLVSDIYADNQYIPNNGIYSKGDISTGGIFYGKKFTSLLLSGGQVFNAENADTLYMGNPSVAAFYLESDNNNLFHNRTGHGVGVIWDQHNFNPDSKLNKSGDTMTGGLTINSPDSIGSLNLGTLPANYKLFLANSGDVAKYGTVFFTESDGTGYIQQQRADGQQNAYRLSLQPYGGELFYNNSEVATRNWTNANFIPKTHPAYGVTQNYLDGWFTYKGYGDARILRPENIEVAKLQFGFTAWNNDNTAPWADFLHFGGYPDASGGNQNLIAFKKNGFGLRQWQGTFQSPATYQSFVDYWHSGHFNQANVDSWNNMVSDYVTLNTFQNINGRKSIGGATGNAYNETALEIRGGGSASPGIFPALSFHQGGSYAATIQYRGNGFYFRNINNTSFEPVYSNAFCKENSDDSYVLLGGGGHKSLSDFLTTDTVQHITNRKFFDTYGSSWGDNSLIVYAINPVNPAMTFYKEGISIGQLGFDGGGFHFVGTDWNGYFPIKTNGFIKNGLDDNSILLAGGGHKPLSDFALSSQLGDYWKKYTIAGYTGINASTPFGFLNGSEAQKAYMGGLLVSNAFQDEGNIPYLGIYSKGNIRTAGLSLSDNGFQNTYYVAGRNRIWSFANSDQYGLSYQQGGFNAGGIEYGEGINFHFGDSSNFAVYIGNNGTIYSSTHGNSAQWKQGYDLATNSVKKSGDTMTGTLYQQAGFVLNDPNVPQDWSIYQSPTGVNFYVTGGGTQGDVITFDQTGRIFSEIDGNSAQWKQAYSSALMNRGITFTSNTNANQLPIGTEIASVEIPNGTGNTNFPMNEYGTFMRMSANSFTTDFMGRHGNSLYYKTFYNPDGANGASWRGIWDNVNLSPVTLDTPQTIIHQKTFNAGIGLTSGQKLLLAGYSDSAHYVQRFNDDTDGFGVSTGFVVKPYNNENLNWFLANASGAYVNGYLVYHAGNFNPDGYQTWVINQLTNYLNKFAIDYTGSNHDLNTLSQTGFYSIAYGAVNSGNYTGAKDGYRALLHLETENIYSATQIQAERYNGNIVSRTKADGGWSNWVRHWGNNDFTQSDIDNWTDAYNNQSDYIPLTGTNNLTGLLSTPDSKVQIGRDQYYEGKLWVSDYNNSYFPGQSFQLLADIENGFNVAANENGTIFSNLNLYPGGVYITSSNNGSSNAYNINNEGIFAQYKVPMFDGSFVQRKYLTDNYVSQSSFNSNDFVTTTGTQLISGAKEFVAPIMASAGVISANAISDEVFVGDGSTAQLRDEIVNDESEYAIRLDPHHYEIDSSGNLEVNDRNRLIHIIGEEIKMSVNFKEIYPKQQIVIYNFDQKDYPMTVLVQGKPVYSVKPGAFLRLYVTKSLRVIAESQLPCEFIW